MWEIMFMVLILKTPMIYVCWIVWWAIKAEPVAGAEGDEAHEVNWTPWRRPAGPRPRRGGPHRPRRAAPAGRGRGGAQNLGGARNGRRPRPGEKRKGLLEWASALFP